jgi:GNAT superfamily N-acetyltransferase
MIRCLGPDDLEASAPELAELLIDAVDSGASVGFLAPLTAAAAAAWWRARGRSVTDGSLLVWVAEADGKVTGTVSLLLEPKANSRHRASLIKLMVHRQARGQGLARRLLATAEQAALDAGRTLLILDTETDSDADHLYRATGWTCYGIVPGYAADPGGVLRDCSFFYKHLTGPDSSQHQVR